MIPNRWVASLESHEVRRGRAIGGSRLGERLVAIDAAQNASLPVKPA